MTQFIQRYLLPGLVFQGIVIGGGYATGRELIEFFLPSGPLGGLFGLAVTALVWSLVMAVSFELCRRSQIYDYRGFFRILLGRWWFLYEVLYFILMLLVLAVIGAAAGEIVADLTGHGPLLGTVVLLISIGVFAFFGTALIERFMGIWSVLLYILYATLVVWCLFAFGDNIGHAFSAQDVNGPWIVDGIRYAGYNVAVIPAMFFCLRHLKRQQEALTAGALAGIMAILPGVFLYIALMAAYPDIGDAAIPSAVLLDKLGSPWFSILFQIVLLGTLIQTGIGLVHTVNERIAAGLSERGKTLHKIYRPLIAVSLLLLALSLAMSFGIIGLIARGYGMLTYGFIAVFVIPILTIGVWRLFKFDPRANHNLV